MAARYTFCAIVDGYQRWHIRQVDRRERSRGRAVETKNTLCGIPSVRDIDNPITPFFLNQNGCSWCMRAYTDALAKERRYG